MSSSAQKGLVSDKIKTLCDRWDCVQAFRSRRHSFIGFLTFPAAGILCYCKTTVVPLCGHQQWHGCVFSLSAAPRSPDSCFAVSTGPNETPHVTNAPSEKAGEWINHRPEGNQDIVNGWLPKDNSIQIETITHTSFMTANGKNIFYLRGLWWATFPGRRFRHKQIKFSFVLTINMTVVRPYYIYIFCLAQSS